MTNQQQFTRVQVESEMPPFIVMNYTMELFRITNNNEVILNVNEQTLQEIVDHVMPVSPLVVLGLEIEKLRSEVVRLTDENAMLMNLVNSR